MTDRRVFVIVIDSCGCGNAPDAALFSDEGANTLKTIAGSDKFNVPVMEKMGLFNIAGNDYRDGVSEPSGCFGRMTEKSNGKDTTIGHWEIAGIVSPSPLPTYPEGFPTEVIEEFEKLTGRKVLCNKPYSGTEVIKDYGKEHMDTGALIVYTSADSVFQIAAHEDIVPVEELYKICETARGMLKGKHGVGRVIARPFIGEPGSFTRTPRRHDFSLTPPAVTMMDALIDAGYSTYGVGTIYDIFAGKSIQHTVRTQNNADGMDKTLEYMKEDFSGLCFVNLVDTDMIFGHRRDIDGYANSVSETDAALQTVTDNMRDSDILMITADHGCDPGYKGTDHTREMVPLLVYGKEIKAGVDLGTRTSFADVAATILDIFGIKGKTEGASFWDDIKR